RIGEGLRPIQVDEEKRPRDDFFAAFQNAQLPATVPVIPVMRIFKAAYDWLRAGEPSFSGVAAGRTVGGKKQEIAIRLTAADAMVGAYTTVMASTDVGSGADALALSAERAAYKLLYRLTRPSTPVAEIEGRAALRQGLALLAPYARGEDVTTD